MQTEAAQDHAILDTDAETQAEETEEDRTLAA